MSKQESCDATKIHKKLIKNVTGSDHVVKTLLTVSRSKSNNITYFDLCWAKQGKFRSLNIM